MQGENVKHECAYMPYWLTAIFVICSHGTGVSPFILQDLSNGSHQVVVSGRTHDGVEGVSLVEFSFEEGEKIADK